MDRMAEVAPHVQDDFDLAEGQLAEVELQDREENLVHHPLLIFTSQPTAGSSVDDFMRSWSNQDDTCGLFVSFRPARLTSSSGTALRVGFSQSGDSSRHRQR